MGILHVAALKFLAVPNQRLNPGHTLGVEVLAIGPEGSPSHVFLIYN